MNDQAAPDPGALPVTHECRCPELALEQRLALYLHGFVAAFVLFFALLLVLSLVIDYPDPTPLRGVRP